MKTIYYVGIFDPSALEDGEIRETRLPDCERYIFSSLDKARKYANALLSAWEEGGATIEKDTHNPDDPDECWLLSNGTEKWYVAIERTALR